MGKSIFTSPAVAARFTSEGLLQAANFLVKQNLDLVLSDTAVKALGNVRLFSSTPICRLYQNLVTTNQVSKFLFYNLSNYKGDIPSALTAEDITIDGSSLAIPKVPDLINKCWINITPITTKKDLYHDVTITDTTKLAEFVVRAALVDSYTKNDLWMSYNQLAYIIEFYSSVIASQLRNAFNLNEEERRFIATVFAMYYAQLLMPNDKNKAVPSLLARCTFLGSVADIVNRLKLINQYRANNGNSEMNTEEICNIIVNCGPSRMNRFNRAQLYTFLSSSYADSLVMCVAVDYPPYWVYQMLRVASGAKNPLMSNFLKTTNTKNNLLKWADSIVTSNIIVEKMNYGK